MTFPAAGYLSNSARTEGEMKTAFEDWLATTKQLPGGTAESTLTLAGGFIWPTASIHSVDTEAAAAADDLTHAAVTGLPNGSLLLLRAAAVGRVVTVKYAGGGTGQFDLRGQQDAVLTSPYSWLLLTLSFGTQWTEIARFLGDATAIAEYSRLEYVNATTVALRAGVVPLWATAQNMWHLRVVPDAGIILNNGGLSANTKYFIYAIAASSATVALEASVTGRALNGGVQCKQADRSRTLVGMIQTGGAGEFVDSLERRTVASWYSRRTRIASRSTAGPVPLSLTTPTALANGILFLQWGDQSDALVGIGSVVRNDTATKSAMSLLYVDGGAYGFGQDASAVANDTGTVTLTKPLPASTDALRTVQLFGQVDAGIGSWSLLEEWAQFSG